MGRGAALFRATFFLGQHDERRRGRKSSRIVESRRLVEADVQPKSRLALHRADRIEHFYLAIRFDRSFESLEPWQVFFVGRVLPAFPTPNRRHRHAKLSREPLIREIVAAAKTSAAAVRIPKKSKKSIYAHAAPAMVSRLRKAEQRSDPSAQLSSGGAHGSRIACRYGPEKLGSAEAKLIRDEGLNVPPNVPR